MSILSLKRWERVAYEAAPGVEIFMKLKRLKRGEAKPLSRVLVSCFEEFERAKANEMSPAQKASILNEVYTKIPEEQLKDLFAKCVKDVEGLTIDDEPITTGTDLLDNLADDGLLFWLLFKLNELSKLTSAEPFGSASRSGSLRVGTSSGSSPATTTDGEAGREPSTATAIPDSTGSSTAE